MPKSYPYVTEYYSIESKHFDVLPQRIKNMTFAAVTKILKVCTAAVILNYSSKREKRKLIYFSERKNNQALKAVHPLQGGSNATEEYGTRIQDIK